MNIHKLGRVGAVVAAVTLLGLQLLAGSVSASTPNWRMTVALLPPTVQNGDNAGYLVTIFNDGPSNISSLFLVDSVTASPVYVAPSRPGTCTAAGAGDLYCSFGALNAGDSLSVTVAYATSSGTSFSDTFEANTGGATFSDKNKTSHGDTLRQTVTTALSSSRNFAGGFSLVTGEVVSDDLNLHPTKNKQSTSVASPSTAIYIPVTAEDGITTDLCSGGCPGATLGEWSRVNVNSGATYSSPFKITITIIGNALPNGLDPATVNVYHVGDDGSITIIGNDPGERCDSPTSPSNVPADGCVSAAFVGNNLQIVIWTYHNGGFKGGI